MNPKNPQRNPGSPDEWVSYAESDLRLARLAVNDDAIQLTPYAVETRYPGLWMKINETEVEEALSIAEKTISWAKEILSAP